ncbi:unnamed protein product [Rhizophagus irregularis]|nr:unnamed protein product [Rhizophagus irregularis]
MSSNDRVTIDVDKRRAALKEIDDAKFGWQHIRACLVAGYVYYGGKTPANIDLGLKVSGSIGTLLGQLFFGYLADRLEERSCFIVAGQSRAYSSRYYHVWRVVMGVGIGGDILFPQLLHLNSPQKKEECYDGLSICYARIWNFRLCYVALVVLAAFRSAISPMFLLLIIVGKPTIYYGRRTRCQQSNFGRRQLLQKTDTTDENDGPGNHVGVPKASWSDSQVILENGKWKSFTRNLYVMVRVGYCFYGIGLNNGIILSAMATLTHMMQILI